MCPARTSVPGNNMAKKMLIDATHPEETRVVVVDGNKVEDFDFESINKRQLAGNIYLAKVTRVEPSLQAAFVEYGGNRHGFLAFSEIHPDYYQIPIADREALLAEEEREEEERRVQEEAGEAAEKPRRGRKRRNRKDRDDEAASNEAADTASQNAAEAGAVAVAGLEVIDVDVDGAPVEAGSVEPSVPRGLEIAEPDAEAPEFGEEAAAAEAKEPATEAGERDESVPAEDGEGDTASGHADLPETPEATETAETAADPEATDPETKSEPSEPVETGLEAEPEARPEPALESVSDDQAAEEADAEAAENSETPDGDTEVSEDKESDAPVKTMTESAGLDDDERVTEEIAAATRTSTRKTEVEPDEPATEATSTEEASAEAESAEAVSDDPQPSEADPEAEEQVSSEGDDPAAETADAPDAAASPSPVDETQADNAATEATAPDGSDVSDGEAPAETADAAIADEAGTPDNEAVLQTEEPATGEDAAGIDSAATAETAAEPSATSEAPVTDPVGDPAPDANADDADETTTQETEQAQADSAAAASAEADGEAEDDKPRRSRRRRRTRGKRKSDDETAKNADENGSGEGANAEDDEDDDDDIDEIGAEDVQEEVAATRTRLRRKYKIQDVVKVRQIMLVQVVKEERGNKGAALTTYLSLAGRYCVLMPNTARGGGISRKIVNASDRKRLREITTELEVPKGMGLIVRTAGAERTRAEIKRDYEFLTRQWEQIRDLTLKSVAPTLIYEEGSLIKRSIRDIYSKDIDQILVEGEDGYREAKEYMKMLMPSHAKNVQPYSDPIPLFSRYQVESYLNGMFDPTVQLRSGGYIVIGVTEALVAIDVNSGRATKQGSIEETALQTNLEAADEVARQLRLRDLAGLIVIDFIDMDENRNNRAVEKRMKDRLKTDRARIQVGRISGFGLMEMSRQRLRPGMLEATTQMCPTCQGMGLVRSDENLTLSILREVEEEGVRSRATQITIKAPVPIANYLINHKRETLVQIEERHGISVAILADPLLSSPDYTIERSKAAVQRPERQSAVVTSSSVVSDDDVIEEAEIIEERDDEEGRNRKRRGKRGGRRKRGEDRGDDPNQSDSPQEGSEEGENTEASGDDEDGNGDRKRSRRGGRRRRGGRNRRGSDTDQSEAQSSDGMSVVELDGDTDSSEDGSATPDGARDTETATEPDAEPSQVAIAAEATGLSAMETTEAGPPLEADAAGEAAEVTAETITASSGADGEEQEVSVEVSEPEPVVAAHTPLAETAEDTEVPEEDAGRGEPEADVPVEPEASGPDSPPKPKRRGWWSFGR